MPTPIRLPSSWLNSEEYTMMICAEIFGINETFQCQNEEARLQLSDTTD